MYVPFGACVFFSKSNLLGAPVIDVPWGWIAGLLLSIIGFAMLVETTLTALKKTPFTARNRLNEEEGRLVSIDSVPKA
jgi:putative Mn2+ efflux pump MntP